MRQTRRSSRCLPGSTTNCLSHPCPRRWACCSGMRTSVRCNISSGCQLVCHLLYRCDHLRHQLADTRPQAGLTTVGPVWRGRTKWTNGLSRGGECLVCGEHRRVLRQVSLCFLCSHTFTTGRTHHPPFYILTVFWVKKKMLLIVSLTAPNPIPTHPKRLCAALLSMLYTGSVVG